MVVLTPADTCQAGHTVHTETMASATHTYTHTPICIHTHTHMHTHTHTHARSLAHSSGSRQDSGAQSKQVKESIFPLKVGSCFYSFIIRSILYFICN